MENKVASFEDLIVWKEAMNLCYEVYDSLISSKDFGLRDQIQRSSVSIPSNIAEGFERETDKEFIRFLYIAKGSCGELRTQLYIAKRQKTISENSCDHYIIKVKTIAALIQRLISSKKNKLLKKIGKGLLLLLTSLPFFPSSTS